MPYVKLCNWLSPLKWQKGGFLRIPEGMLKDKRVERRLAAASDIPALAP
jgi:hypothetical protein